MSHTWPDILSTLVAGRDLTNEEARWAMDEVFAGAATPVQIAAFVVALRAKGETVEEVAGIASAMLAAANPISVPGRLLDVVGTGGDRSMSVNISTMSAIVAAGAGAPVAAGAAAAVAGASPAGAAAAAAGAVPNVFAFGPNHLTIIASIEPSAFMSMIALSNRAFNSVSDLRRPRPRRVCGLGRRCF